MSIVKVCVVKSIETQTNASPAEHQGKTVADYNYARPDYLDSQFPREVSGWHNFSAADQALMKMNQESFLTVQLGYTKNADGSFTKSRAMPTRTTPAQPEGQIRT